MVLRSGEKMKLVYFLIATAFGSLACTSAADPVFKPKPGFYSADDPDWKRLSELIEKADFRLNLSWHAGISLGDKTDLTLEQLKVALKKVKKKALASVLLEKNYTDNSLHLKVEKILLDEGFEGVLITGAHSRGTYLERHTTRKTGQDGAAKPASESKPKGKVKLELKPELQSR